MTIQDTTTARFAPGQVVRHREYGYRGLIFDVDASYSQSPDWEDLMENMDSKESKPWYYVMVDGEKHTTYVAEENLIACNQTEAFEHPLFDHLFQWSESGDISTRMTVN